MSQEYEVVLAEKSVIDLGCVILYKNIIEDNETISITSTAAGYSINNIYDYKSYTKWKADSASEQILRIAFSEMQYGIKQVTGGGIIKTMDGNQLTTVSGGTEATFKAADSIGIFNHNLKTGTTVTIQYNQNGQWITSKVITIDEENKTILETFERQESTSWQIILDNLSEAPEIAIIFLGEAIYFPFRPRAPYSPYDEGIEVLTEQSNAGHLLGSIIAHHPITIQPYWELLTRTWFNQNIVPFWHNHAKLIKPFFFGWDLVNRPNDIFYCWIDPATRFREVLTLLDYTDEFQMQLKAININ